MLQAISRPRAGKLLRSLATFFLAGVLLAPAGFASAQATLLPGVPASVVLVARFDIDLAAGNFRWQTTNLPVTSTTGVQVQTHRGFVIATDMPAQLKDGDGVVERIPSGGAAETREGALLTPTAIGSGSSTATAHLTFVELPLVSAVLDTETPDRTQPLTLATGSYTLAVLRIPVGANAPSLSQIVAGAAAPAIAVYPLADNGTPATTAQSGNKAGWIVAIFPRP